MSTETIFEFDITNFPVEQAYWSTHKDELIQKYPNKYLVIRGESVALVVNDTEDLLAITEDELPDTPGFPCSTRPFEQVSLLLAAEAFWKAHKDSLEQKYPAKRLIIRGNEVTAAVDTITEQAEKEEAQQDPNYIVRMTKGVLPQFAHVPFNYVANNHHA